MIRKLERILLPRFPMLVLKDSYTRASYLSRRFVDAFFVPDARGREFARFLFDELPALLDAAGLSGVEVSPFSTTNTLEYHPEIPPRRVRSNRQPARTRRRRTTATSARRA